jgi:hypothetical protein
MAQRRNNDRAHEAGITHFPLREEQESENRGPDPGQGESPSGSPSGHRLSRSSSRSQQVAESEGLFEGKGGKGGKTRGSCAGLLSASRKVRKGRT